ncbi:MAG: ribose 5-phosphate isomerase A, partial [Candidatus Hecatellaceae archaeon]
MRNGQILGLGSGRTVSHVIAELGRRVKEEGLNILCVPSSYQAMMEALQAGLKLTDLYEHHQLDLTLDGADEVDSSLNLTKGGGAALAREKILASASKRYIIVVDEGKLVEKLGLRKPIPVEVLPFAAPMVKARLEEKYGRVEFREGSGKLGPTVTDNGNFILDVYTGPLEKPEKFEVEVKRMPGVVEVGIFTGLADEV